MSSNEANSPAAARRPATVPSRAAREAALEETLGRETPLVPTSSIAGRSLVIVIAIMTFLAALSAGAALMVADASVDWRREVAREASVQIRLLPGRDIEADVSRATAVLVAAEGVRDVRVYSKAESEALLAPWLGQGLDLAELPAPRMIVVKLDDGRRADLDALRRELAQAVPSAALDDHRLWVERLGQMARTVVAVAALVFVLIVVAMGLAVAFATRAAMVGNREIIEVLHLVGAADKYIAQQFQRRFLALGLKGGLIGGASAMGFFLLSGYLASRWTATPDGDQLEAMFGRFSLGPLGFTVVGAIAAAAGLLTGFMSQEIVFRQLRRLDRAE
ncbi:ABC transporter permease [Methylosinus sp. Ce-a6]|uniref:cell division protein FtsX n=1 Tax=Methylosinus sp. Ce-a6 TaxID=2172005 RepID=UPI001FCEB003|nr:ABC transporter permease [Methylosinus sp. Ce-a6]